MTQLTLSTAAQAALRELKELWRERHAINSLDAPPDFCDRQAAIRQRHGLSWGEYGRVYAQSLFNVARELEGEQAASRADARSTREQQPMSDAVLSGLQEELADVARETARLLLDSEHDGADVLALDVRAEALRRRLAALARQPNRSEPVELWRGGGALLVSGG